jgi:hypothetical protein
MKPRFSIFFRAIVGVLSICMAVGAVAREGPITSCSKAPMLAELIRQFPAYMLGETADVPPGILSPHPVIARSLLMRSGTSLVCVVVALDEAGTVQSAGVVYPRGMMLTAKERERVLATRWASAKHEGKPTPSVAIIEVRLN